MVSKVENSTKIVYVYDREFFYYAGTSRAQFVDEQWLMPPYSTEEPPPYCSEDKVAVFDVGLQKWTIQDSTKGMQPILTLYFAEYLNLNSKDLKKRPSLFFVKRPDNVGDPNIVLLMKLLAPLSHLDRYISNFTSAMVLAHRINYLDKRIADLYSDYRTIKWRSMNFKFVRFKHLVNPAIEMGEIIHGIKRILDLIVLAKYLALLPEGKRLNVNDNLRIDGLGEILKEGRHQTAEGKSNEMLEQHKLMVRRAIYYDEYRDLFKTINDIHNAFKHDVLTESVDFQFFLEPTLNVRKFQSSKKDLKKIIQYQIEFSKIIYATNDYLLALFQDLKPSEVKSSFHLVNAKNCN